jgi:hypothetical protein
MKKSLIARGTALALILGALVTVLPSANAALRVPKATWPACSVAPGTYCVDSVTLTDARGHVIPLVWVPSGQNVPSAPANSGPIAAPLAGVDQKGIVREVRWDVSPNRDTFLSPTVTYINANAFIGTANMPTQGAKQDPKTGKWDTTETQDSWSQQWNCWDNAKQQSFKGIKSDCVKGAVIVTDQGEAKWIWYMPNAQDAINTINYLKTVTFVDVANLAKQHLMPSNGSTYDAKTQSFSKTEALMVPTWVRQSAVDQNWTIIGDNTGSTVTPSDSSTAIPDTSSVANSPVTPGRALSGRWTSPNWSSLGLDSLGYDGLYVDAKAANEFVNHVFIDVNPVMTDANNKDNLAAQTGNKIYAANLDPDVTISVKVRTGDIKTGVTIAVGVDTEVKESSDQYGSELTVTGNPVSVPIAKSANDCKGEAGVAVANVRQFQTLIVVQNDTSGFGVDGTSGNMYVGSNGVCGLSTPTWNPDDKTFTWQTAAPHFASDGTTQNMGFYKAVIPFQDAALLWGLTNPADAATALTVSVSTEAGGSSAAIAVVSAKAGNIVIDVSGFGYSKPKLMIGIKKGYKPSKKSISSLPLAKSTVTCILGKTTKKITAPKPVCPAGYKKLI